MQRLYCPECGEYLEGGNGSMQDCSCGWRQPKDCECETAGKEEDCEMFVVGQRVKAKKDLYETSDELPNSLYAAEGEELIVRAVNPVSAYPFLVSHEGITRSRFGVTASEIAAV